MSTQSFISCHSYRSIRKQIYLCHKNGQCQPRVIIWTKPQGMGIQPLGTSSGNILKLLLFPSSLYQFQKDPFCLIILYGILFYFIHVYSVFSPRARWDNPWGQFVLMEAERSYHFDHWLLVSKISYAIWFYTHFFVIFYMYIALGRGQTTHKGQHFDVNRKASSLWSFVQPLTA